jgi:hypothetical protein
LAAEQIDLVNVIKELKFGRQRYWVDTGTRRLELERRDAVVAHAAQATWRQLVADNPTVVRRPE